MCIRDRPEDVVAKTRERYVEAYERLTGRAFDPRGGFFEVTGPADA